QLRLGLLFLIRFALLLWQRACVGGFLGPLLGRALPAAPADRQIAHMADTGLDDEIVTQIAVDGLRLGWRFDNYQGFTHSLVTRTVRGCVLDPSETGSRRGPDAGTRLTRLAKTVARAVCWVPRGAYLDSAG